MDGRPYHPGYHPVGPRPPAPHHLGPSPAPWAHDYGPPPEPPSKTILIQNLARDTSEDDLRRIFSQLGAVVDLWVVVDKYENPMGLAYCEFRDSQAVHIAVSHLNRVNFKGNQIIIEPTANQWREQRAQVLQAMEEMDRNRRPQLEYPDSNREISSGPQDVSSDLANLNSEQMFNLMHQMKLCIEADPVEARSALLRNFTLSAAMLQALLMMKLVDPLEALAAYAIAARLRKLESEDGLRKFIVLMYLRVRMERPAGQKGILMREDDPAPVDTASSIPLQGAQTYSGASLPHTAISGPSGNQPRLNAASPQIPRMPVDPRQARVRQEYSQAPQYQQLAPPHLGGPITHPPTSVPQPVPHQESAQPNQSEMERAGLLLQLLQMTDQQLAGLPPDQRQAVLMLREQLAGHI